MDFPLPAISRQALFSRLAAGSSARVTVVTPNRRLAQALACDYDEARAGEGLAAWESADILPWNAFVERLWDQALHSPEGAGLPLLLQPAEEQALWESVVGASRFSKDLYSPSAPAAQCREAWQLLHGWRLSKALATSDANEDVSAFRDWSARYERLTRDRQLVDMARLPDALAGCLAAASFAKPAVIVLYAYDLLAPQARDLLAHLSGHGAEVQSCEPRRHEGARARVAVASPKEEIAAAARWARVRLEAGLAAGRAPRICVVVPELGRLRTAVERIFASTLHPGNAAPGSDRGTFAFEISLGEPLSDYPPVRDALLLLALSGREIAFEDASRLLRSPFLAGGESEMAARARLDAALREIAGVSVNLDGLVQLATGPRLPRAPILMGRLSLLAQFRRSALFAVRSPSEWARAFGETLSIAGFPGERSLASAEFQVVRKWHETIAAFARLERVMPRMGFHEARLRLASLARDTLFQPESPDVPVQVMGILESAGLAFDHLWVTGLTDEAWPLPARPNPFLPLGAQRSAGIPAADANSSLALDRRITAGWLGAAPEVVLSHATMQGDALLDPSPLISSLPAAGVPVEGRAGSWRDAIRAAARLERIIDERGPALVPGTGEGGTSLFRDQAACPFRAFAAHRLGSEELETPQAGLSAKERGTLLHLVLAEAWAALRDKGGLDARHGEALDAILTHASAQAIEKVRRRRPHALEGRFMVLERERLVRLARAWLEYERGRSDFEVVATESRIPASFGGITVNGKIDRLDRLRAGGCVVIDYKTGDARVGSWLGARPDEPQVPIYALACGEDIAAVAFARVKTGENEFRGLAGAEGLLPGATTVSKNRSQLARDYEDWPALLAGWRRELDALGRTFASGDARVDPKNGLRTCEGCAQALLCRVAENPPPAGAREEGDE